MIVPMIGGALPSIAYCDDDGQNTAVTTHTFTSKSIGTADNTRLVIVPMVTNTPATTISMTIGGVSATSVAAASKNGASWNCRIFTASLDASFGTTSNVVVTLNSTQLCYIGVFAAYNLTSTTAVAGTASEATPIAESLNVSDLGIAVGYSFLNAASNTFTYSGMTKKFDRVLSSLSHSGAIYTASTAQSPLSNSVTFTGGGSPIGCAASFR